MRESSAGPASALSGLGELLEHLVSLTALSEGHEPLELGPPGRHQAPRSRPSRAPARAACIPRFVRWPTPTDQSASQARSRLLFARRRRHVRSPASMGVCHEQSPPIPTRQASVVRRRRRPCQAARCLQRGDWRHGERRRPSGPSAVPRQNERRDAHHEAPRPARPRWRPHPARSRAPDGGVRALGEDLVRSTRPAFPTTERTTPAERPRAASANSSGAWSSSSRAVPGSSTICPAKFSRMRPSSRT
jgi:hypothetical protein